MMLGFRKGTDLVAIKVMNKQLFFTKWQGGLIKYSPIDNLRLNPAGIVREFPDLKGKPIEEIKRIALQRLKNHIKKKKTKREIMDYLVKDLKKHGYTFVSYQFPGHRMVRVKEKK